MRRFHQIKTLLGFVRYTRPATVSSYREHRDRAVLGAVAWFAKREQALGC